MILGHLTMGEHTYAVQYWIGYGFVCPDLVTTNGECWVIYQMVERYLEDGFSWYSTFHIDQMDHLPHVQQFLKAVKVLAAASAM